MGQEELDAFLHDPGQYVSPAAPHRLPPPHLLPARRSESEVKAMFPKRFEFQGFCPVTYIEGKKRYMHIYVRNSVVHCPALHSSNRYESLVPGNCMFAAEYRDNLYCFASETHLDLFMQ